MGRVGGEKQAGGAGALFMEGGAGRTRKGRECCGRESIQELVEHSVLWRGAARRVRTGEWKEGLQLAGEKGERRNGRRRGGAGGGVHVQQGPIHFVAVLPSDPSFFYYLGVV